MSKGDNASELNLQEVQNTTRLIREVLSDSRWSKESTHAEFKPPALIPALRERCERIQELLAADEIRSLPSEIRVLLFKKIKGIHIDVEKADDARRQFLHPLATANHRRKLMYNVEYHIEEAHKKANEIAREMERDRLVRKRRPRQEKPYETCARSLLTAAKWLGPHRWCQGWEAVDNRGRHTLFNAPEVYRWSIVGVIRAATQLLEPAQQLNALRFVGYAAKCKSTRELQEWNDKLATTHADVKRALSGAVRLMARNGLTWQTEFDL